MRARSDLAPLVLVAGVHGAGKTHFAARLAVALGGVHWSASQFLPNSGSSKAVSDVPNNQEIILRGLSKAMHGLERPVVLDGHFTLVASDGLTRIDPEFFRRLRPVAVLLLAIPVGELRARLERRDKTADSVEWLQAFSKAELQHAAQVCASWGIPLKILDTTESLDPALDFLANEGIDIYP